MPKTKKTTNAERVQISNAKIAAIKAKTLEHNNPEPSGAGNQTPDATSLADPTLEDDYHKLTTNLPNIPVQVNPLERIKPIINRTNKPVQENPYERNRGLIELNNFGMADPTETLANDILH